MITERDAWSINGYLGVVILTVMTGVGVLSLLYEEWIMSVIFFLCAVVLASGFTVIQPNHSVIVQFAGNYIGTYRDAGMVLFVPFSKRIHVTLREQVFKSEYVNVHDMTGTPVSLSIMLLFKIVDAAKAYYDVDDLRKYIAVQSEMSVRKSMTAYTFSDLLTDDELTGQMTQQLEYDLYSRLDRAGVALTEIRLIPSSLTEINKNKDNPVELTEHILDLMERENLLPLNEEAKNKFKNKLTVSLSSE